jgi:hypothetical protein
MKESLDVPGAESFNLPPMKTLRMLLLAPFFVCAALAADTSAPAAAPTPSAPEKVVAPAVQADAVVAADAVLKALHYDEMMSKGMNQQKQAALAYIRQTVTKLKLSGTSPQDLEAFEQKALDAAWAGLKPEDIHANAVRVYGEIFTADELKAMANFFGSPVGQSVTAKQSQAQQKIMAVLMPQLMQVGPKIQQMTRDFAAQQQAKAAESAAEAAAKPSTPATSAAPKP